jgi:hypothetical protein
MNKPKYQVTFEKVKKLKGVKKLPNGHFVDLPYCPCCKTYVESLMEHLKNCEEAMKEAKKWGN